MLSSEFNRACEWVNIIFLLNTTLGSLALCSSIKFRLFCFLLSCCRWKCSYQHSLCVSQQGARATCNTCGAWCNWVSVCLWAWEGGRERCLQIPEVRRQWEGFVTFPSMFQTTALLAADSMGRHGGSVFYWQCEIVKRRSNFNLLETFC